MADSGPNKAARDRLQAVLAAYGADPAHWPERDRELAQWLGAADPVLATSLNDARTMDRVLTRASHPAAPAGAVDRLVARVDGLPGKIVPIARPGRARAHARRAALPRRLAVLSALAASLALGLYLGASGRGDWLTPPLLAEESPENMSSELDVLDSTVQLFEDHI